MKKISLIASLLLLTTTQSLFLMDAAQQKVERRIQYAVSNLQELNKQIDSFNTLQIELKDSKNRLDELYSELIQPTKNLSIIRDKIQETKATATNLEQGIMQSLEIQRGIKENCLAIKQVITPPTKLISNKKERDNSIQDLENKNVQELDNKIKLFQKITISYTKDLDEIRNFISQTENAEDLIKNKLTKRDAIAISAKKNIIITISFYALLLVLFISRYIYKNYHGNIRLLFKSA